MAFGIFKPKRNEVREYSGSLSERIMGWRRIGTPEVQGYTDWLGRPVGEPGCC